MNYFTNLSTVGQVKSEYRTLAKLFHPDRGGDTKTMQEINAAYHTKLENLNGQTSLGTDGKEHTYHYNRDIEQEVMDKVFDLLKLNMADVEIEIIGTWVWVSGDTKPHKESIKELGCRWHSKRVRWYWRQSPHYRRTYSGLAMDELRAMYGNQKFANDKETALAA